MTKKKYGLNNSYFKVARMLNLPVSLLDIAKYEREHGELPFNYSGKNWVYDAFCEYQKRGGITLSQYLTPDNTVDRMLHFAGKYFEENLVLEPCCGTGQITKELLKDGYNITAFDIDPGMVEFINFQYPKLYAAEFDFREKPKDRIDIIDYLYRSNQIISNPPYDCLPDFLQWILNIQDSGGISILLLPFGFVHKDKPKALVEILRQFSIQEKEDMREPFLRTGSRAEIVVLKKF